MSKILKKIFAVLLMSIILISNSSNIIKAAYEITEANIQNIGLADYHLKYYNATKGMYTYCICYVVGHYQNGNFYPAYCLNKDLDGVGKRENYSVDVDSIIENEQVWRAVKNGYPYKSAKEMGLNSDFDAFAVTKFAVYCVLGQSDINLFRADEGDEEGQAMLRALHNLVEIGTKGTEKRGNLIKIEKQGNIIDEGEFYSQVYNVKSDTTVDSYTITSVTGISSQDLITDLNNNSKVVFNSNESFKIRISKTNLDSNKKIDMNISAKLKSYPMYYGKTRITGTQNYLLTANSYQDKITNYQTEINLNNCKIKVEKVDMDTKVGIEKVEFELYNSNGKLIKEGLTDSNGNIVFTNLFPGSYVLKEVKTNEKYILNKENDYKTEVKYNNQTTVYIENEHKKGDLEIIKVDKDNNLIALENVEFDLYSNELKKVIGTYHTDSNGKIKIENLRIGEYSIIEKSTNTWYNLAEAKNIEVKWNETTNTKIENELKKSQIQIEKVDKDNNSIKLKDVEFEILDKDMNLLEKIVTDENGIAKSSKYVIRDYEYIYLKEVKTNENYILKDELIEIKLIENETVKLTLENEKIKGNIKIIKTSKDENKITGQQKGQPLKDVEFEIYNEQNKIIDKVKTNEEGIANFYNLEKGKYFVKEVATNEWYLLDNNSYEINIKEPNKTVILELENESEDVNVEIDKKGEDLAKADDEIVYNINIKNTGNVMLDYLTWEDEIPTEYFKITKLKIGTFSNSGLYNIYYKTNLNNNYTLFLEDLNPTQNAEVDFTHELIENEYITNIKYEFKNVEVGFKSENNTLIYGKVDSKVKHNDEFENKAIINGSYKGYNITKNSSWKTKIIKILPVTGM